MSDVFQPHYTFSQHWALANSLESTTIFWDYEISWKHSTLFQLENSTRSKSSQYLFLCDGSLTASPNGDRENEYEFIYIILFSQINFEWVCQAIVLANDGRQKPNTLIESLSDFKATVYFRNIPQLMEIFINLLNGIHWMPFSKSPHTKFSSSKHPQFHMTNCIVSPQSIDSTKCCRIASINMLSWNASLRRGAHTICFSLLVRVFLSFVANILCDTQRISTPKWVTICLFLVFEQTTTTKNAREPTTQHWDSANNILYIINN